MGSRNVFNVKLQENFRDSAIMVRFKIAVLIYHDLEVIVYPCFPINCKSYKKNSMSN